MCPCIKFYDLVVLKYSGKNRKARKKQQLKQKGKRATLLAKLNLNQSVKRQQKRTKNQQKKTRMKQIQKQKMKKSHSLKLLNIIFGHYLVFKATTCKLLLYGTQSNNLSHLYIS